MRHFNTHGGEPQSTLSDVLSFWVPHARIPVVTDQRPNQPPCCQEKQSPELLDFSSKQHSRCTLSKDQHTEKEYNRLSLSLEAHKRQQCDLQPTMNEGTYVSYTGLMKFLNPRICELEQKLDCAISSLSKIHVQIETLRMSGSHQIKNTPRINKKHQKNLPVPVQPRSHEEQINAKSKTHCGKKRPSPNDSEDKLKRCKSAIHDVLPSVRSVVWRESPLERKRRTLLPKETEELLFVSC